MPTWKELTPWIEANIKRMDCNASELARRANVSPSTILRGLNKPNYTLSPTLQTLRALARVSPIPFSEFEGLRDIDVIDAPIQSVVLSDGSVVITIRIHREKA
jgi:transcriptional regulator with XRE-family HTH domain